jgi:hypothetical protein
LRHADPLIHRRKPFPQISVSIPKENFSDANLPGFNHHRQQSADFRDLRPTGKK